jgi:hypothetical protein
MTMKKRQIYFFSALFVVLTSLVLLASGSSVLTLSLDKENNVPLGTFITWFGLICLPLSIYWSILEFRKPSVKLSKSLSIVLKIVIVLALLWVPIILSTGW